jgi:hypothetical protein
LDDRSGLLDLRVERRASEEFGASHSRSANASPAERAKGTT